jgi:CRP-like cAMP-binding protein
MSRVYPLNSRRGLLSTDLDRDAENEADITTRTVPVNDNSEDEEDTIRDNIQRLIHKDDYSKHDDRSEAMNLINLRNNLGKTKNFGNNTEQSDEESVHSGVLKLGSAAPFGILLPESRFMTYWTVLVLSALFYTATIMPYLLAFYDVIPNTWLYIELFFDLVFFFDFVLNFNIAYYEKYDVVVSRGKILRNYITGWFWIDLSACFPFSLISLLGSDNSGEGKLLKMSKLTRVTRVIRIFRLVKVIKTAKFIKWYNETMERLNISVTISRGIKFACLILVLLHLVSCAWFFIDRIDNFSYESWVVRDKVVDRSDADLYLFSIYWALTVLDTIGYGDIVPLMTTERVLCLIWLVFGVSFYSYAISNLSVIFYNMNTRENYIKRKEEYLKEFAHNVKLPKALLKQVKYYVRYNYRHNVFCWSDMNNFLKELPSKLYMKVYSHIFKKVLDDITFFKCKPPAFISEIMPMLKKVVVHEGYELYSYGSSPRDMFFLLKGRVMVKDKNDAVLFSYVCGSYFGEIELLYKTDRKSSIQVEQTAELLKVDGQDFISIIERYPEIKDEIEEVAAKRYHYFIERKKKFKEARRRLEELQKKTNTNLININPLIQEIMNYKIEETQEEKGETEKPKEEEEEDYQTLTNKIAEQISEIQEKIFEVSEFYEEVFNLKKE